MEPFSAGCILRSKVPFKQFPPGTKAWIYREREEHGQPAYLAMFFHQNFSGSNRHYLTLYPKDRFKFCIIGKSLYCSPNP